MSKDKKKSVAVQPTWKPSAEVRKRWGHLGPGDILTLWLEIQEVIIWSEYVERALATQHKNRWLGARTVSVISCKLLRRTYKTSRGAVSRWAFSDVLIFLQGANPLLTRSRASKSTRCRGGSREPLSHDGAPRDSWTLPAQFCLLSE